MQASAAAEGAELVQEVWDLVDEYHADPHGEAFNHQRYGLSSSIFKEDLEPVKPHVTVIRLLIR